MRPPIETGEYAGQVAHPGMAFLRFTISADRNRSTNRRGLFGVAYALSRSDSVAESDREQLSALLAWAAASADRARSGEDKRSIFCER